MNFYTVIAIACIVIIILLWRTSEIAAVQIVPYSKNSLATEHFDTYFNHDLAAMAYRQNLYGSAGSTSDLAAETLYNRYNWRDKDRNGDNIFDKVYEKQQMRQYSPVPTVYDAGDLEGMYGGSNGFSQIIW